MSDTVIKAEHLSKMYRLGVINNGTLWKDFQTWMAIKRGRDDPHSKIGEDKYAGDEDHFWALKDLDFEIKRGDRVGIIGKNGAGKSTLLKILSRITSPTEGSVKIKGKVASLLEVGTGFHGELTGRENIYLNGAILGMKKRRIDKKMDEIIAFSGIDHHIDTPVKRYSSGMYVRLAFAVAAHLDSDILIADEVLAVGDAEFQKKALGKMQDLSTGEGRTVLFVSHQMHAVKSLCNIGILLKNGYIDYIDGIESIIDRYINQSKEIINANNFNSASISAENIRFRSISICDCNTLIEKSSFAMGEDFLVKIEVDSNKSLENYEINLRLHTIDGINLCAFRTRESYFNKLPDKKGLSTIYLHVKNPNLFSGKYAFTIALTEKRILIENIDYALTFYIKPEKLPLFNNNIIPKENVNIFINHSWNIE